MGTLWDAGDSYIPPVGARAVFYLQQRSGGGWSPIYPNGVTKLDESTSLAFPRESVWLGLVSWPYVLVPAGALVLLALVLALIARVRRRRAAA